MVVLGTHGRGALGKLLLGSVAEQIFRHSIVLSRLWVQVLTRIPWSKKIKPVRPFCFLRISGRLPCMLCPTPSLSPIIFGGKTRLCSTFSRWPRYRGFFIGQPPAISRKCETRREWLATAVRCFEFATYQMAIQPEFMVKYGIPSEQILLASHALKADLIILGLHHRGHIEVASHMPWHLAYKVGGAMHLPVLTIRN